MSPQNKFAVAIIAGMFVVLVLLIFAVSLVGDVSEPADDVPIGVDSQLWALRSLDMLILVVMIFAGALGVLALVGGEFKWQ